MATVNTAPVLRTALPPQQRAGPSLAGLVKGRQRTPHRIVLYGVEGIGKTTFAADAPKPIFIPTEDGCGRFDVDRFPLAESWQDVLDAVRVLTTDAHGYKTLALDTLDRAEFLLWDFICKRDGKTNVEDYGYGKGYIAAQGEWRVLLAALERLSLKRGMNVILGGHSYVKTFKNPQGDDFDRYLLKLNDKAAAVVREWAETVLFANFEVVSKEDKRKRIRGVSTGARYIYTTHNAAYDAKHRDDLPDCLPLSWVDFAEAVEAHQPADPAALKDECERKAREIGGKVEADTLPLIAKNAGNAAWLARLNDRLNAKLAEKNETAPSAPAAPEAPAQ